MKGKGSIPGDNEAIKTSKEEEWAELLYRLTHDLKGPMVTLKGFGEELLMGLEELSNLLETEPHLSNKTKINHLIQDDLPGSVSYMQSSVRRISVLLEGLNRYSRISSNLIAPVQFDPSKEVERIVHSVKAAGAWTNALVNLGPFIPIYVTPSAFSQVLTELLKNAFEAIPPDREGEIGVSTKLWESGTLLVVTDNGEGISNSKFAEIFTIFTQLGRKKADQSGVGLAIVKQWVELHHGNVSCESVPDEGSTFYCYFPNGIDE